MHKEARNFTALIAVRRLRKFQQVSEGCESERRYLWESVYAEDEFAIHIFG